MNAAVTIRLRYWGGPSMVVVGCKASEARPGVGTRAYVGV
jgi:hypothetical protein